MDEHEHGAIASMRIDNFGRSDGYKGDDLRQKFALDDIVKT